MKKKRAKSISLKEKYTMMFMRGLNQTPDPELIKQAIAQWWVHPRGKGLRLSDEGFKVLQEQLELRSYSINFSENIEYSKPTLVFLDQYLDSPYFLKKRTLVLFSEERAVEFMLFANDIRQYGKTKAMNSRLNLRAY